MKNEALTVMVTGASAGIGRATAQAFARLGARVGLLAGMVNGYKRRRQEMENLGGRGLVLVAGCRGRTAVEAAAGSRLEREFGPIDVQWVNNAMASVFSPIMEMTANEFRRVTNVTYAQLCLESS